MRVVDVRDFCIPSDENNYDELVEFADTMAAIPEFDAVPIDVLEKIKVAIKQEKDEVERSLGCELGFDKIAAYDKCLGIIDKCLKEDKK